MTDTATAIGLVLRRSARQLAAEAFYSELISGLEEVLAERGMQVLLQVVDSMNREMETYRRWVATNAVRASVMIDLVPNDPRPAMLAAIGLPGIILGEPGPDVTMPAIRTDGYTPMVDAVERLVALGHRRIGRVSGPAAFVHTQERTRGLLDAAQRFGVVAMIEEGDYTAERGRDLTLALLARPESPTAVIYDNDAMAIAGLDAARTRGVSVPEELSLIAWDDSQYCRLATPPLSAMSHDIHGRGLQAARAILAILDGEDPGPLVADPPVFVVRGSTGPASAGSPVVHAAVEETVDGQVGGLVGE
ncbi:LacI family DNA-binding transcriptional regulator [Curtobacterium ammoniigenes]|uniref:LacI family DNA-binding transcriptional regulator n=1 Tax=Curtobacterium ammoniigenes TaxID=395387 RepID=UPI000829C66F|nr:substrate-binding domain-containing protein [Curtobacterium ammoniigenes]